MDCGSRIVCILVGLADLITVKQWGVPSNECFIEGIPHCLTVLSRASRNRIQTPMIERTHPIVHYNCCSETELPPPDFALRKDLAWLACPDSCPRWDRWALLIY